MITKMISQYFWLLVLCLTLTFENTQSQCSSETIAQKMFIDDNQYCRLLYEGCNDNSFIRCQKLNCPTESGQCVTTLRLSGFLGCKRICCRNAQSTFNSANLLSLKLCTASSSSTSFSQESSTPIMGGYIFLGVLLGIIFILFILYCVCRKYRTEQIQTNPNQNNAQALPATCVDLKAYDISQEGPYFVNSNEACVICLEKDVNLRTHCNHFYHGNCLLAWLKKKANNPCPLCMGTNYNPVKVYCKECHNGDMLVNIHASTTNQMIVEYDSHKCQNCKRSGDSSFTLSDQGNKNGNLDQMKKDQPIKDKKKEDEPKEPKEQQKHKIQPQKYHRRPRKGSRKRTNEQNTQTAPEFQRTQIENSAKKIYQDHQRSAVLP